MHRSIAPTRPTAPGASLVDGGDFIGGEPAGVDSELLSHLFPPLPHVTTAYPNPLLSEGPTAGFDRALESRSRLSVASLWGGDELSVLSVTNLARESAWPHAFGWRASSRVECCRIPSLSVKDVEVDLAEF